MNIKLANRLQDARKKHGYSQEELADKLKVSRQAVSKWERAEASPDTDNLIALAELYNMKIDDLLGVEHVENETLTTTKNVVKEKAEEDDDDDDDKKLTPKQKLCIAIVSGSSIFVATLIYFILGYTLNLWHPAWIVFLLLPLAASLADAIIKKEVKNFAMPVLVAGVYLIVGFLTNLWHPMWVIFLTIPIYYIVLDAIENYKKEK